MSLKITLKRGLDINIMGEIATPHITKIQATSCAIIPDDYHGFTPKLEVKEGDIVSSGSPILHDKNNESIKIVSPISGRISAIIRGERRKIEKIIISSSTDCYNVIKHDISHIETSADLKNLLLTSGLWAMIRQRPFDIIPSPDKIPRDIFITGFDSTPLAPNFEILLKDKSAEISIGLNAIAKLTDGKVYVGLRADKDLCDAPNVETVIIKGSHPAGNPGIQAANISPVNKGETIWATDIITIARIGELIHTGIVPMDATIALTGSEIAFPHYITTTIGAEISAILDNQIVTSEKHIRIISGNVLTGYKTSIDGFLRYPYRQITVIPEGDDIDEFMGWATLSPNKMSVNRSFIGHFFRKKRFCPDARILGSRRAMIMSGEYDKVLPMDIMAEYLIKAIISRNIDDMEKLGIYEIAPEDFALCEYVDTSKLEIQKIIREGLNFIMKETT